MATTSTLRELWDTTRMRLLVEIERQGSVSAAAAAIGIGQPSASQHLRLLELPDGVVVYPSHYAGSVCGRSLSGNPSSTIGFERRHNGTLKAGDAESFARALLVDVPPPPADQAAIVAANKRGVVAVRP